MLLISFLYIVLQVLILVPKSQQECYDDVAPPVHGHMLIDESHEFYRVVCDHGYILYGSPVVYCKDGQWNSPPPRCIGSESVCNPLPIPQNGEVNCDPGPLSVGKSCTTKCNEGYILRGNKKRLCMMNYQWSGLLAYCIPITRSFCNPPPPLANGTVVGCSTTNLPRVSDTCSFRCNEGFELSGPPSVTCTRSGNLVDEKGESKFPICEKTLSFVALEQNPDSTHSVKAPTSTSSQVARTHENPGLVEYNPCSNHSCEQLCRIEKGRAQCRCGRGYKLNLEDQRTCNRVIGKPIHARDRCHERNGGCEQLCSVSGRGELFCSCRAGYRIDERDPTKCINKAPDTCRVNNGGCEHDCTDLWGRGVYCTCRIGYKLHDDQKHCIRNARVTCQVDNGGCQHHCDVVWRQGRRDIQCRCLNGYTLHTDGKRCSKNAPTRVAPLTCQDNNGGCEHFCHYRWTAVHCSCRRGYKLHIDGKHCVDIDECSVEIERKCQQNCVNTEGSYECSCKPGFLLVDGHKCEGCGKNSYYSTTLTGCIDCPENSHTESEGKTSITDCTCDPGFVGSPGNGIKCQDMDECRDNNLGCSDTCVNIPGGAYCSCSVGFMLDTDNKTCIDIDECSVKNGGCEGICHNLHGSFHCNCPEGFKLSNKDHYSCDDVNECEDNNGGCEQECINYRGGYYCTCEKGYRLDSGLKNCTDIHCPVLSEQPNSHMKCKMNSEILEGVKHYPVGAICTFPCDKGFKNTKDSNQFECQTDGKWEGSFPICKAQNCHPLSIPENGAVHPPSCATRGIAVKQKCTFSCNPGYNIQGKDIFVCKNNLTWNNEEIPVCEPEKLRPRIVCPSDITVYLLPGQKTHKISLKGPTTNMDSFNVHPDWVSMDTSTEFPAGISKVIFTAVSPHSNKTARCIATITVLDDEPPVFTSCPDPIEIENASAAGEIVTWVPPEVTDNVEVESVYSVLEPNTTLTPGSYIVEYIARDTSGNSASCSFDISIIRANCSDLSEPANGAANCADWMFGKICQPECEAGYMRNPDDPPYYSCDDSGIWEPSDIISDCLQFTSAVSSTCPDGFVLKTNDETAEEFCIECPPSTKWSPTTKECEQTVK